MSIRNKGALTLPLPAKKSNLSLTSWIYGFAFPLIYLVVEFSFCHQLLMVLGDGSPEDLLSGFEFWGRLTSGFGLGILIFRLLAYRIAQRAIGFGLSIVVGILLMWKMQQNLIDYLIEAASPQDKRAATALIIVAPKAGDGRLQTLSGEPIVASELLGIQRAIVTSLFPAAALHAQQRELQLTQWLQLSLNGTSPAQPNLKSDDDAYRALVVAPLVIGLSLFFALLNLSLVASFLLYACTGRWRTRLASVFLIVFMALSLAPNHVMLDAAGYRHSLRPDLWREEPVLAMMVEWSARAATRWALLAEQVHRRVMLNYEFKPPYFLR